MMGEYGGRICLEDAAAWRHSEGKVKWAAAYATSLLCGCREEWGGGRLKKKEKKKIIIIIKSN